MDIHLLTLLYSHQNGRTALINAAYNGHSEVVRLLLEAGALTEAKDNVSKRISICTCVCVYVCVCGERGGERGGVIFHHTV